MSSSAIDAAVAHAGLEQTPLYAVDEQQLLDLKPDLVLTQGVCSVCAVSVDTLRPLTELCAVPIVSLSGTDLEGVFADVLRVADAVGIDGRQVVDALRARWAAIVPVGTRPRVAVLEWSDPPWTAGHSARGDGEFSAELKVQGGFPSRITRGILVGDRNQAWEMKGRTPEIDEHDDRGLRLGT